MSLGRISAGRGWGGYQLGEDGDDGQTHFGWSFHGKIGLCQVREQVGLGLLVGGFGGCS